MYIITNADDMPLLYLMIMIMKAALIPLLLLKLSSRGGSGGGRRRLPPGPSRLPVIGSLHHFLFVRSPLAHRTMADLARRHGAPPLMYLRLGKVGLAVASSPAAAREVMRAHDAAFASRPWIPSMRPAMERGAVGLVFAPHGALWRQLRRDSVLELLSARRVRSSPPGRAVNVGVRLAALTADVTMRAVVDDRFDRREEFLRAIEEGSRLVTGFSLGDLFPSSRLVRFFSGTAGRVMDLHRKMFQLMDCAIRQHEERRAAMASTPDGAVKEEDEDILGLLLRIHREGGLEVPLTMDIVKSLILVSNCTIDWHSHCTCN
jgi:hypothetical protein